MKPEITKEHKWMKKAPDFKKINPLEYIVFLFRISKESQQVKKEMKVFKSRKEELENIITYKTYYAQNKRPSNVDPILLDTDWKLVQIELITDLHTFKKQTMSYKMEQEAINIIEELEKY